MSKTELRKYIAALDAPQLREMLLEVYSAGKEIKEFLDFYLNPDSRRLAEKYRAVIEREFHTRQGYLKRRPRRSVCKRALADFRRFSPDPEVMAEVMLFYVGEADRWMRMMSRKASADFAASVADTFAETMNLLLVEHLIDRHRPAVELLIENSRRWAPGTESYLAEKWSEVQSRSVASLLAGGIEPQQNENQNRKAPKG